MMGRLAQRGWRRIARGASRSSISGIMMSMSKVALGCDGLERAREVVAQARERDVVDVEAELAGLDLREIEDARFSAISLARMSELLSGVRGSCDMLARSSDLARSARSAASSRQPSAWPR
jgi:hypothetical protein